MITFNVTNINIRMIRFNVTNINNKYFNLTDSDYSSYSYFFYSLNINTITIYIIIKCIIILNSSKVM